MANSAQTNKMLYDSKTEVTEEREKIRIRSKNIYCSAFWWINQLLCLNFTCLIRFCLLLYSFPHILQEIFFFSLCWLSMCIFKWSLRLYFESHWSQVKPYTGSVILSVSSLEWKWISLRWRLRLLLPTRIWSHSWHFSFLGSLCSFWWVL